MTLRVQPDVGVKEHTIARNLVKSTVHQNVEKLVVSAQIHVIAVMHSALVVALDQQQKIALHVKCSTMTEFVNLNARR